MKTVRLAALTAAGLLTFAVPAGASTPVVAGEMWYYWLAPILTVSTVGLIVSMWGGYIRKVLFPKYRGRKVQD